MVTNAHSLSFPERRRFLRIPWSIGIYYQAGPGADAYAMLCDIGRGGVRMLTQRFLYPDSRVMLRIPGMKSVEGTLEFKAKAAWCRPVDGEDRFVAGVRVLFDDLETVVLMSAALYEAAVLHGALDGPAVSLRIDPREWTAARKAEEPKRIHAIARA